MTKPTSQMTLEELARTVAQHQGWRGEAGGWIYGSDGHGQIAQGYLALGRALQRLGIVKEGTGIDWHAGDLLGWGTVQYRARSLARAAARQGR